MNNTGLLFPLLILLLFIPILLSGRRQKRQMQQMQQLQSSLNDGDVVVTTSGLRGTVVDSSYEDTIDLEIAPGVITTWVRAAVREKVNPPVDDGAAAGTAQHAEPTGTSSDAPRPAENGTAAVQPDRGNPVNPATPADTATPASPASPAETPADTAKPGGTATPTERARPAQPGTEAPTSDPTAGRGGA